ncbi:MAG: hypothetical protein ACXACH_06555, partial [Candidatus Hermodarchaeia archaeon]
ENVLRCLKCGQPVSLESTKTSGGNKVLSIRCLEHGTGQRKISSSIHDSIMRAEMAEPTPAPPPAEIDAKPLPVTAPPPAEGEVAISFCWNCGAKAIETTSQYCHKCGVSLRPP